MIYDVAIVGAGLSGLSAARYLVAQGLNVVIVEKSQGVGGRAATRRIHLPDGTVLLVDHGAQFFTARDPLFQAQVSTWLSQGVCFEWATGFHTWDGVSLNPPLCLPRWDELFGEESCRRSSGHQEFYGVVGFAQLGGLGSSCR
jgi:predicted NAD/FAD-dependent oxidoreductase